MKIVNYIPTASFYIGGGEVVPIKQSISLAKNGHHVNFLTVKPQGYSSEYYEELKSAAESLPNLTIAEISCNKELLFDATTFTHPKCFQLYLGLTREVNAYLAELDYDTTLVHYSPGIFAIPKKYRLIQYLHGTPPNWDLISDASLRLADINIAVSQSIGEGWASLFSLDQKAIKLLHNGIDIKSEPAFIQQNDFEQLRLLYAGRLIETKGVQDLIAAVALMSKQHPKLDWKLHIVGDGTYKANLQGLVTNSGLQEKVLFKGYVTNQQLEQEYKEADICIFPSYAREGVLTTLLEAASYGKAIITADCCGMTDFVEDGLNGVLFDPRNVVALAQKIAGLAQDPKLRLSLARRAYATVQASWQWQDYASRLERIINNG